MTIYYFAVAYFNTFTIKSRYELGMRLDNVKIFVNSVVVQYLSTIELTWPGLTLTRLI